MSNINKSASAAGLWRKLRTQLVARRGEKELSQADVAAFCGVTRETIGHWERGDTEPKATELSQWAAAVGHRLVAVEAE